MRILLVATNRHNRWMSRQEVRPLPIGLAYVAAYVDLGKHTLKTLDLMFAEDYLAETEKTIREYQPELVGISLRNLDNGSFVNPQSALPITRDVIQRIRNCSSAIITCGGPAFSTLPQQCYEYLEPDLGLAGDAAETFAELADLLQSRGITQASQLEQLSQPELNQLSGIVYRDEDVIKTAPHRASSGLSKAPRLDDLDLSQYRQAGFGVGVITKLGWYSSTVAAPDGGNEDSQFRLSHSAEQVMEEVKRLQSQYQLQEFFFIDQAFNQPPEFAKALCRSLINEGLNIRWNTNLGTAGTDQEMVSLMVNSGCQMILLGGPGIREGSGSSESFSNALAEIQQLCDLCHQEGLAYSITQGFGEPGETDHSVTSKLAFLAAVASQDRSAHVTMRIGARLLPGSPLIPLAREQGVISSEEDLLMPAFFVAPEVKDHLVETLAKAAADNPSWHVM